MTALIELPMHYIYPITDGDPIILMMMVYPITEPEEGSQ